MLSPVAFDQDHECQDDDRGDAAFYTQESGGRSCRVRPTIPKFSEVWLVCTASGSRLLEVEGSMFRKELSKVTHF